MTLALILIALATVGLLWVVVLGVCRSAARGDEALRHRYVSQPPDPHVVAAARPDPG